MSAIGAFVAKIQAPSYEGLDLDDNVVQALDSLVKATQAALNKIEQDTAKSLTANITISTPDGNIRLKDLGQFIARRGEIRMFFITWGEAFGMRGWRPCTGAGGTPAIMPDPKLGGESRFPRGAGFAGDLTVLPIGGGHLHPCDFDTEVAEDDPIWVDQTPCSTAIQIQGKDHFHAVDKNTDPSGDASTLPPYCDLIFMMKL